VRRPPRTRKTTRPSTQPRPTAKLLGDTFRWLKLDDTARSFLAMRAFSLAAGPLIGEHARGERLRGVILYVRCESSAWTHHLHSMKPQLLERLRRTPGGEGVQELRFNVGPLSEVAAWEAASSPAPATQETHAPTEDVARALDGVHDPELRQHLERLYARLGTRRR
jgi:hypothetical protein